MKPEKSEIQAEQVIAKVVDPPKGKWWLSGVLFLRHCSPLGFGTGRSATHVVIVFADSNPRPKCLVPAMSS